VYSKALRAMNFTEGSLPFGCANAPVVENNDTASRGDAVDDRGSHRSRPAARWL